VVVVFVNVRDSILRQIAYTIVDQQCIFNSFNDMSTQTLSLITTEDGSPSFYNPSLDETYHSRHGAIQESMHVFIKAGIEHLHALGQSSINILEIGFGTGLNAALALEHAQAGAYPLRYASIELYPIPAEVLQTYIDRAPANLQTGLRFVSSAAWNEVTPLSTTIQLEKISGDARTVPFPSCDVLFLDAFAPSVSPDLWTIEMMEKYYNCILPSGVLVTYCAKGAVRRAMQSAGFKTERIPGPPGKREMLRGTKSMEQ
jgi:tRNA U34 5-methylaminomethyl-2-thiouridine-forming methyltransferase MnmC